MKNLIIIGARGYGREVVSLTRFCIGYCSEFSVKGYLDSDRSVLERFAGYPPIIASPEDYEPLDNDVFFCAMGDVKYRRKYVEMIKARGGHFISLIHRDADIGISVEIGEGCFIRRGVTLTTDIKIGEHTAIFDHSMIGHDCVQGDFCHLSAHTFLGGGVRLGNSVTLHPGARVVPHKKVGEGSVIGAGSVLISNARPHKTYFGIPAVPFDFGQT